MPCPPDIRDLMMEEIERDYSALKPFANEQVELLHELAELFEPFYDSLEPKFQEDLKIAKTAELYNYSLTGWQNDDKIEADRKQIENYKHRLKRDEIILCRLHTEFFRLLKKNKKVIGKDKVEVLKKHESFHLKHRKADRDEWVKSLEVRLKNTQNDAQKAEIEKMIQDAQSLTKDDLLTSREYVPNRSTDN